MNGERRETRRGARQREDRGLLKLRRDLPPKMKLVPASLAMTELTSGFPHSGRALWRRRDRRGRQRRTGSVDNTARRERSRPPTCHSCSRTWRRQGRSRGTQWPDIGHTSHVYCHVVVMLFPHVYS